MGQRNRAALTLFSAFFLFLTGCDKPADSAPAQIKNAIVSLSPAATDLLVAMGKQDQVVGVTPYDNNPALPKDLSKVGDYQRIDWERLAELKPSFLIVQGKRDRLPAGIEERCKTLGIAVISLEIDRYKDIEQAAKQIGDAIDAAKEAEKVALDLQSASNSHRSETPPVPALIVLNDEGTAVVGRDNFINDALEAAGGVNVAETAGYLKLDREKLRSLKPKVIYYINSERSISPKNFEPTGVPVVEITRSNALLPGACVVELVRDFAAPIHAMHKASAKPPATQKLEAAP